MISGCLYLKKRLNKGKPYWYCAFKRYTTTLYDCSVWLNKEDKKTARKPLNKLSKTNKITKATAIPKEVKLKVWERDNRKCIFCHKSVPWNCATSHYIKRSHLGLGIEEDIFTACPTCHHEFDDTTKREYMLHNAKKYLMSKYDNWNEETLVYKKWR